MAAAAASGRAIEEEVYSVSLMTSPETTNQISWLEFNPSPLRMTYTNTFVYSRVSFDVNNIIYFHLFSKA